MDLAFERTWGGPGFEIGEGVAVAPDGSVYLTGQTTSFGTGADDGDTDIFLIKYGPDGSIVWQRTYGVDRTEPFLSASDFGMDVEVGPDGSVYVTGEIGGRIALAKFDPDGNLISEVTWGEGGESPRGMAIAGDGSIYVVGFTFTFGVGEGDAALLKFAPDGTLIWQKTWGGTNFDIADDVALAADGSVYVAGDTNSFFGNDAFLLKLAPDGTVIWERDWREEGIQGISASHGVAIAPDQSVYLTGRAQVSGAGQNAFLVKFTPAGSIVWEKRGGRSAQGGAPLEQGWGDYAGVCWGRRSRVGAASNTFGIRPNPGPGMGGLESTRPRATAWAPRPIPKVPKTSGGRVAKRLPPRR